MVSSSGYVISVESIAYVGDDINDLEVVKQVGFGCSVRNGVKAVTDATDYVPATSERDSAIREIIGLLSERWV